MKKQIAKVHTNETFYYLGKLYLRLGNGFRAACVETGETKLFRGTELVEVVELRTENT